MKKFLAILLTIAMLCACVPAVTATAAAAPTISVGEKTARAGETVSVDVVLSNNPGVYSV